MMNILLQILDPAKPLEVAKGISELGVLVVIAGFSVFIGSGVVVFNLIRNAKSIDRITIKQQQMLEEIVKLQRDMFTLLKTVSESIGDETYQQIRAYGQACIENNKFRLYYEANRIREQYGLKNREEIAKKVSSLVRNAYNERGNRFDLFIYKGKKLSEYVEPSWTTKVIDVIMESLYMEDFEPKKMYENLDMVYNDVLNEFYRKLL